MADSQAAASPGKTIFILVLCQSLAMTGATLQIVVSALAGATLAEDKALATLPISLMFIGNMAMTIPASLLMKRIGRRAGFTVGAMFGVAAGLISAWGIYNGSFVVFALGGLVQGFYNAHWQYYRFAAAEAVEVDYRSRAISYVLLAGIVAAIVGPKLATVSVDMIETALFAGSFLTISALAGLSVFVIQFLRIPMPGSDERLVSGRPIGAIAGQPTFLIATMAGAIGYGSMAFVMTATPLAMEGAMHSFPDTAEVISWHALGMFVPSLFTGQLIRFFGAVRVVLAGTIIMFCMIAAALSGSGYFEFWTALVLLGIGWNFMFVGGSTLLTEVYTPAEKAKVQGVNDFLVFGTNAFASLSAGAIYHRYGWEAVNYAVILPLLLVFATALWLRLRRKAAERAAVSKAG